MKRFAGEGFLSSKRFALMVQKEALRPGPLWWFSGGKRFARAGVGNPLAENEALPFWVEIPERFVPKNPFNRKRFLSFQLSRAKRFIRAELMPATGRGGSDALKPKRFIGNK